eukprot:1122780-Amphidinium_carterae.1
MAHSTCEKNSTETHRRGLDEVPFRGGAFGGMVVFGIIPRLPKHLHARLILYGTMIHRVLTMSVRGVHIGQCLCFSDLPLKDACMWIRTPPPVCQLSLVLPRGLAQSGAGHTNASMCSILGIYASACSVSGSMSWVWRSIDGDRALISLPLAYVVVTLKLIPSDHMV